MPVAEVWQDREIRFDAPISQLALRAGEAAADSKVPIDAAGNVEDTKGNSGELGTLTVSNLRLTWHAAIGQARVNLSIGWACVVSIDLRDAQSQLHGKRQAMYVMTKFNTSRFEFVFATDDESLFASAVYRAYDTSRLFRDLKLRGAIIKSQRLLLLPGEIMVNRVAGVWNLSSDQGETPAVPGRRPEWTSFTATTAVPSGNLGTFFLTNVRLVWHADAAESFNVSIPYMQAGSCLRRSAGSRGTDAPCGGYVLGFRMDPAEHMKTVFKELSSMHAIYSREPIFGVDVNVQQGRQRHLDPGADSAADDERFEQRTCRER
ncbi:hypothetical protein EMIHUDRAFT_63258 [Emiliania huxleyi CCMP1516]|uniref:BBSome complex member BBS5 PH domain-containing protein n=2 Tax=Emiliania huxleyi TaxID=2903 RepID=A0A0D3KF42_EMIH1|nr:hypothetical protein EMIHUDRAFT_63258 [Emiliania huxleyi CCMP1516]EOD34377.1 hypothetical protein EMIHUDRAFT_63258 [Emiliania huxleyi CCMP1516]|eukprot:XP_005786806.1 hypothetical protein EMIHUDRAFT_63258 [Emiliania huxleyi CCMP1516]